MPLINHGYCDYGENKVQEALDKWTKIKQKTRAENSFSWKTLTNKVKFAKTLILFIQLTVKN